MGESATFGRRFDVGNDEVLSNARAELEKDRIVVSEIYPFITATNFGKNRMGDPAGGGPAAHYAEGDKPEFVAGLVLQPFQEGQAQYSANDRLRKMAGAAA